MHKKIKFLSTYLTAGKKKGFSLKKKVKKGFHTIFQLKKKGFLTKMRKIANLISKLNFYKLIPYPMDNC